MFDRLYLRVKCPNCGDESEKELQTKDLDCNLDTYRAGDSIGTTQFRWLRCLAGCVSTVCSERKACFGRDLYAEIDEQGIITGKVVAELPACAPRAAVEE